MSYWMDTGSGKYVLVEQPKRWTAGSAVALYEKLDHKKPWSSRRAILRLLRELLKGRR